MAVSFDVAYSFYLPERRFRVHSYKEFGVLKGHHLIVGRVDNKERHPLVPEPGGVFTWLHHPGVEAQKELGCEENAGAKERRKTGGFGQLLSQEQWEVGIARLLYYGRNASSRRRAHDRRPAHRPAVKQHFSRFEALLS